VTETTEKRADTTRQELLRAAAHQFAQRPYHLVGLDDVLAEAELTKGAMYFHFSSKHALALALIEDQSAKYIGATQDLLARKLSGLETLVDVVFLIAIGDISEDIARAGLHLLESVGRIEGLGKNLLGQWIQLLGHIVKRAIAEGDLIEDCEPEVVGRLFVSTYLGMRQTSDLDQPEEFLRAIEQTLKLLVPGIVRPERIDYFRQFISRRTALAIKTTSAALASK
jgi:AcrR family transcriptional regulator